MRKWELRCDKNEWVCQICTVVKITFVFWLDAAQGTNVLASPDRTRRFNFSVYFFENWSNNIAIDIYTVERFHKMRDDTKCGTFQRERGTVSVCLLRYLHKRQPIWELHGVPWLSPSDSWDQLQPPHPHGRHYAFTVAAGALPLCRALLSDSYSAQSES